MLLSIKGSAEHLAVIASETGRKELWLRAFGFDEACNSSWTRRGVYALSAFGAWGFVVSVLLHYHILCSYHKTLQRTTLVVGTYSGRFVGFRTPQLRTNAD